MDLSATVACLGMFRYGELPNGIFSLYYSLISRVFSDAGIEFTYIGAEGAGYSGEFAKIGGRVHKRLIESSFRGISVLSLAANPHSSDSP